MIANIRSISALKIGVIRLIFQNEEKTPLASEALKIFQRDLERIKLRCLKNRGGIPSALFPLLESSALGLEKMSPMEIESEFRFTLLQEVWSIFKVGGSPDGEVIVPIRAIVT